MHSSSHNSIRKVILEIGSQRRFPIQSTKSAAIVSHATKEDLNGEAEFHNSSDIWAWPIFVLSWQTCLSLWLNIISLLSSSCYSRLIREIIFLAIILVPWLFRCRPFLPKWERFTFELSKHGKNKRCNLNFKLCCIRCALELSVLATGNEIIIFEHGNSFAIYAVRFLISSNF